MGCFRRWRLSRIRSSFLDSCRTLEKERRYWRKAGPMARWLSQLLVPTPLLALHAEGQAILDALRWLEAHCRQQPLSEAVIRHYHGAVYRAKTEWAGRYRSHELSMPDDNPMKAAAARRIPGLMARLDSDLLRMQKEFDALPRPDESAILTEAVRVHHRIGTIHPFGDGNGRAARLSMNHLLRRYGLPYVVFPSLSESPRFWSLLKASREDQLEPLVAFARENSRRV